MNKEIYEIILTESLTIELTELEPQFRYSIYLLAATVIEVDVVDLNLCIFDFRKPFVHHNLLFYTVILQEFLNRAEKLNLRSSKDTQLFYRVTKVFSQEHLMPIIHEGMLFGNPVKIPMLSSKIPAHIREMCAY